MYALPCLYCRLYARYMPAVLADFQLSVRRTPLPLAAIQKEASAGPAALLGQRRKCVLQGHSCLRGPRRLRRRVHPAASGQSHALARSVPAPPTTQPREKHITKQSSTCTRTTPAHVLNLNACPPHTRALGSRAVGALPEMLR